MGVRGTQIKANQMSIKTIFRIIADIILFYSVIQGWWFVAGAIGIFGIWYFGVYAEAVIAGFMYDSIFGRASGGWPSSHVGIISSVIVFVAVLFLKRILR